MENIPAWNLYIYYYVILITMKKHSDRYGILSIEIKPNAYFVLFTPNMAIYFWLMWCSVSIPISLARIQLSRTFVEARLEQPDFLRNIYVHFALIWVRIEPRSSASYGITDTAWP